MDRFPPPAAVLFDLDGTLVDTVPTRIAAWARAFDEVGVSAGAAQLGPLIGSDGTMLARRVAGEAGVELDDEAAERLDQRSGEIYGELNSDPRPLAGAAEALAALDARSITWAIATSSRREQVAASVAALDLEREPTIVDGSHVAQAKPAPDLLLLAARELDVDPAGCWYVGDSTWDMESATAAGMLPIAVMAGAAVEREVLVAAGARAVLETLDELTDRLPA
ncbi:MAG TPA: HAD family phosphatase [Candidatus Limnocylindria bacterium]|nr:HAD family phosphatase [Candidatus Limnocylindria bacterium]